MSLATGAFACWQRRQHVGRRGIAVGRCDDVPAAVAVGAGEDGDKAAVDGAERGQREHDQREHGDRHAGAEAVRERVGDAHLEGRRHRRETHRRERRHSADGDHAAEQVEQLAEAVGAVAQDHAANQAGDGCERQDGREAVARPVAALEERGQQLRIEHDEQRERDHDHDAGDNEHLDIAAEVLTEDELRVVDRCQPVRRQVGADQ